MPNDHFRHRFKSKKEKMNILSKCARERRNQTLFKKTNSNMRIRKRVKDNINTASTQRRNVHLKKKEVLNV